VAGALPHPCRTMKKLAIIASLAIATPVFACPGHDSDDNTPRTAEKDKAKDADKAKAKDADKAKDTAKTQDKAAKPADKDKDAKKPDKVSQK
jgi:hypothetical protein